MYRKRHLDRTAGLSDLDPEAVKRALDSLEEIRKLSMSGTPIIVEGKKDREALLELGIRGEIIELKRRGRIVSIIEGIKSRQAVVLTDFDRRGEELADMCVKLLQRSGVRPVFEPYRKLHALGKRFKGVENLVKLRALLEMRR